MKSWTLFDFMEAHDVLDYKEAVEHEANERQKRSMKK